MLAGQSDAQVALAISTKRASISRQAISQFRKRHADILKPAIAEAQRQATDFAIAQKVNRIATNDLLKGLLDQVRESRAKGGTGIETGLVVMQRKSLGSGPFAEIVEEYSIDPALLQAIDRLHRSTAEELGQLPRPDQNINLRAQVLVRQLVGYDPAGLG